MKQKQKDDRSLSQETVSNPLCQSDSQFTFANFKS